MTLEHNHKIPFPNGKGYAPCTKDYLLLKHERDAICDTVEGESLHDLSAEEYQRWSELDNEMAQLQLRGHVGKAVWY